MINRKAYTWKDYDGDTGKVEVIFSKIVMDVFQKCNDEDLGSSHRLEQKAAQQLALNILRLASPDKPSPGEVWLVVTDGIPGIASIYMADELRAGVQFCSQKHIGGGDYRVESDTVQFIALIPTEIK